MSASMIVTSNKPFSAWGEIFGDDVVAAALIDRLVHHAKNASLRDRALVGKARSSGGASRAAKAHVRAVAG
jgi:DNA replication protein DnaC